MHQLAGFAILLFTALLLIVSSVSVKVTAQDSSSSEKSTTAANGSCSPELFKAKPALCAALLGLKHTSAKGSSASAEKAVETGSSPTEAKKLSTEEKKTAEEPEKAAKTIFLGSSPIEVKRGIEVKSSGILTGKLEIKKPANPVSENCVGLQTTTRSGKSLCLTTPVAPKVAYEAGAKKGAEAGEAAVKCNPGCMVDSRSYDASKQRVCSSFGGDNFKQCQAGFEAAWHDTTKKIMGENPSHAGTHNGGRPFQ